MSDSRPPAVPSSDAPGSGSGILDLYLRAFGVQARRPDTVSLAELKSTLATLGIPAETVDRAVAEVREEIAKSVPHTFGGVLHHLFIFSLAGLMGVWAVDAGLETDGLSRFALVGVGVIWLVFCLASVVDAVYVWATRDRG